MAKAKGSTIAQGMQKGAERLRAKAKRLRTSKKIIASVATAAVAAKGQEVSVNVMSMAELTQKALGLYIHGGKALNIVCEQIEENAVLRSQVETLVSNLVEDMSARLNEVANIIDSAAKSPEVQQSFEEAKAAIEDYKAFCEKFAKTQMSRAFSKPRRKRKFSVV